MVRGQILKREMSKLIIAQGLIDGLVSFTLLTVALVVKNGLVYLTENGHDIVWYGLGTVRNGQCKLWYGTVRLGHGDKFWTLTVSLNM